MECIEQTVRQFLSDKAKVLDIDSTPLHSGYQAVDLFRHRILVEIEGRQEYSSVITKMANGIERRVMHRLLDQGLTSLLAERVIWIRTIGCFCVFRT